MGAKTSIEWAASTLNPIRARNRETDKVGWFCRAQDLDKVEIFLDEKMLTVPLRWRKPRMIFVGSMTDLFGEWVTDDMLDRIFAVMALCPQHTFQVLTKRAERMRDYLLSWPMISDEPDRIVPIACEIAWGVRGQRGQAGLCERPLPNVWLGVSVEDQRRADERIPLLLETPAAVRWVSAEPLIGPIDLRNLVIPRRYGTGLLDAFTLDFKDHRQQVVAGPPSGHGPLDWVIVGGEAGPGARPMHPDWVRLIRDQCVGVGVPFFFKQWGEWRHLPEGQAPELYEDARLHFVPEAGNWMLRVGKRTAGRLLDDREWSEYPEPRADG